MEQTKVLFVTDDIRYPSGVGIQAYKLLKGLVKTGEYDISSIAGSRVSDNTDPVVFEGIRLYPVGNGYGDPNTFRIVVQKEKPDIIVFFSDPRFFTWAFTMDNEFRHHCKVIFYHTWDNEPFPKFNQVWYSACDRTVFLSKFSYDLMKSGGVDCEFIPHGGDPTEFYPYSQKEKEEARAKMFQNLVVRPEIVFLYNNRNIARKRTSDVIMAFKHFAKKHPHSALIMNTQVVDMDGNDLGMVLKQVEPSDAPVIINQSKISSADLNRLYNIADVTFNIAINEGFGLSCMESLLAGTPGIVARTGGLIEQMTDGLDTFGVLLPPVVRSLYGIPGNPYIYQDWVSLEQIEDAMELAYANFKEVDSAGESEWSKLGILGRNHIIKNYNIKTTIALWDALLKDVKEKPSRWERYKIHTL